MQLHFYILPHILLIFSFLFFQFKIDSQSVSHILAIFIQCVCLETVFDLTISNHPILYRLPFDSKTPIGYLISIIFQSIVAAYHFYFDATIAYFGIGAYLFLLSLTKDIKANLNSTNKKSKIQRPHLRNVNQMCAIVKIYSSTRQLSFG